MSPCACGHDQQQHDGERGPCRECRTDPEQPMCLGFRATITGRGKPRSPLKPVSDHRRDVNAERLARQVAAWGRPPWTCVLKGRVGLVLTVQLRAGDGAISQQAVIVPPCRGQVHGHEILSRARAGQTDENLLDVASQRPVCNRHNSWLTQFYAVPGLVKNSGGS